MYYSIHVPICFGSIDSIVIVLLSDCYSMAIGSFFDVPSIVIRWLFDHYLVTIRSLLWLPPYQLDSGGVSVRTHGLIVVIHKSLGAQSTKVQQTYVLFSCENIHEAHLSRIWGTYEANLRHIWGEFEITICKDNMKTKQKISHLVHNYITRYLHS